MGDILTFVDTVESSLGTISGLRVYKGPVSSVNQFPCAIIKDDEPLAQYTFNSNEAIYFLTVTVLDGASDPQEAWENLEPYLSASGAKSIRAALDVSGDPNMAYIHVVSSSGRKKIDQSGASYWGLMMDVEGRVTLP